jgi:hypothetical protein
MVSHTNSPQTLVSYLIWGQFLQLLPHEKLNLIVSQTNHLKPFYRIYLGVNFENHSPTKT